MNRFINRLLRMSLTAGLSDRERFVEQVSTLLTERMQADPQQSHAVGEEVLNWMESLREELILKEIFQQNTAPDPQAEANHAELIEELRKLNSTITQLNETLQKTAK